MDKNAHIEGKINPRSSYGSNMIKSISTFNNYGNFSSKYWAGSTALPITPTLHQVTTVKNHENRDSPLFNESINYEKEIQNNCHNTNKDAIDNSFKIDDTQHYLGKLIS